MNGRNKAGRILVALGAIVLLAGAALHLLAGYSRVSAAVLLSNLDPGLQGAFRAVFLVAGCDWIAICVIALVAGFSETRLRRVLVLICGAATLVDAVVMLRILGLFIGTEMIGLSAVLLICGALLFDTSAQTAS